MGTKKTSAVTSFPMKRNTKRVSTYVASSRGSDSSQLSVQKVALAGEHAHGGVWVPTWDHVGSGTLSFQDGAERKLVVLCFRVGIRAGEDGMISCVS